ITYSITIGGCSDTETIDITVNPSADPSITPVGPFCANGTATTLNAATAGGTWSGPGITDAATGAFDPVAAGPGLHVVTYSVTVGGCTSTDTENILVRNSTDPACGGGGGTGCLAFTRFEVINFTRPSCNLQSDGAIT